MASNILVLATRYDSDTRLTYRWAIDITNDLNCQGHNTQLLVPQSVNTPAVSQHIGSYEFILFYGHGEADRLIGQKGRLSLGSGPTLVDTTTVNIFQGNIVYAVCCQALILLGSAYASLYPQGAFIGYSAPFGFSSYSAGDFQQIVNQSAIDLVNGQTASMIVADLTSKWKILSDDFFNGSRQGRPDAFLAAYAAAGNAVFVGVKP
jgi:hypothetical protein